MKSFFILSFILSSSASNFGIYNLPFNHFDVAFGSVPSSDHYGNFHFFLEVRTTKTERYDEFTITSSDTTVSIQKIRQNFIKEGEPYYYFDEKEGGKFVLL